jgi:cleavage and polyadenylation specificity factor subunit 1
VWDEDTSDERTVLRASIADPYILIIRDDSSLLILQADEGGDLDEIPVERVLRSSKWLSGSLYLDKHRAILSQDKRPGKSPTENVLLFLLSGDSKLLVSIVTSLSLLTKSVSDIKLIIHSRYSRSPTPLSPCMSRKGLISYPQYCHLNLLLSVQRLARS